MIETLGLDFLSRTLRTAGIVTLIFLPFGIYYFGFYAALAVFSGAVWGIVNFYFLAALIKHAMRSEGADIMAVGVFALIKFPMLYGAGYALLIVPQFAPLHLVSGFSITLAVMVLKAFARVLLGMDNNQQEHKNLQRAV